VRTPALQRRAFYQSCLFAAFSLFWTTVPLYLADAFGLSQRGIALFALAAGCAALMAQHQAGATLRRNRRSRERMVF